MQILSNYLFRNLFVSPKIIDIWPCYNKRLMGEFFLHHYKIYCARIIYEILQRVIMFTTSRLDLIKFLDKVVSHSRFMLTSTTSKANALKTARLINFSKTSLLNTAARHLNATLKVGKRTQLLLI